jgi:hypothetical protein
MNDLQLVTLYGQGAVSLLAGQAVFRAVDGVLRVPANMVRQAEAVGYRRTRSGQSEAASGSAPVAPEAPTPDDAELAEKALQGIRAAKIARYREEVEAAGYDGHALDEIVSERLRFDDLLAEGKTEEEAAAIVYGGRTEKRAAAIGAPTEEQAGEIPAPSDAIMNADVTALSADAAAADKAE